MINKGRDLYAILDSQYPKHVKVFRFLISGGTATATNLAILYILTSIFGIWYIASAVFSYIASFFVSFSLQKFWTFRDSSRDGMHIQAGVYFAVGAGNLIINTLMLYAFVEYASIHYMLAQFISGAVIAVESYFLYHFFIFRDKNI